MMPGKVSGKNLKILYWNTTSFSQRQLELSAKLQEFDICICVETWLNEKDKVHFPGYVTYRKDRQYSRGGGIIFLIRKNLAYAEITNMQTNTLVELCGIHVNNINPPTNIIACYRTPGFSLTQGQWDKIVSYINRNNYAIL